MALLNEEIRDHSAEATLFVRRAVIAFIFVFLMFGVLVFNLYHLQVGMHSFYQTRSNQNDIKMLPIAPSRGLIMDRNGVVLAQNITLYQIQVIPGKVADLPATLKALTPIVDLTPEDLADFKDAMYHGRRFAQIPLKLALTDEEVARFSVNQFNFPGVSISSYQQRRYPYGAELAHVVGYVSKINDRDDKQLSADGEAENYAADHDIGKQGIEKYYEKELH